MSVLNYGSWDNAVAVVLPYGSRTMQGVVAGSVGVCIPFVIFMFAMFHFLYTEHFSKQVHYGGEPRRPTENSFTVEVESGLFGNMPQFISSYREPCRGVQMFPLVGQNMSFLQQGNIYGAFQ
jgi:hypothetical protein